VNEDTAGKKATLYGLRQIEGESLRERG